VNVAHIINPESEDHKDLYTEIFTQFTWKKPKTWTLIGGVQYIEYDQELYQGKPGCPNVVAITPYADFLYKLDQKKSLRTELQYMQT
jgi:hypothetical protein